ncbi:hypothetical protein HA402_000860 [Bradysia odoriphaga]|nr:hypothetical protein HA402_000860 [Bradysia odoriphaga]
MNATQEKALRDLRILALQLHKKIEELNNVFNSQWTTINYQNNSLKTFGFSVKNEIQNPIRIRHAETMMQIIPSHDIQKIQFYLNLIPELRQHQDWLQDSCNQQEHIIMQQRNFLNQHESKRCTSVPKTDNYELHFGGPSVEVSFENESEPESGSLERRTCACVAVPKAMNSHKQWIRDPEHPTQWILNPNFRQSQADPSTMQIQPIVEPVTQPPTMQIQKVSATVEDEEPNTQQQFDVCGARICSEQDVEENAVAQSNTIVITENIQIVPPHTLDLVGMQPLSNTAKASQTKRRQFRTKLIVESYDEFHNCHKKIRDIDILINVMAMITKLEYQSQISAPTMPSNMTEFLRSLEATQVADFDYASLGEKMQQLDILLVEQNEVLKRQIKQIQSFVNEMAKIGWHRTKWVIGAGINNIGNMCFVNATLQVLFHIPVLVDYMLNNKFHPTDCNEECASEMLFCKLIQLLHKTRLGEKKIRPHGFMEMIRANTPTTVLGVQTTMFPAGRQQDASEFMLALINLLNNELQENSPFSAIFQMQTNLNVQCTKCGYTSSVIRAEESLHVALVNGTKMVKGLLDNHFAMEICEYMCPKCEVIRDSHRTCSIIQSPVVLMMVLKRFDGSNAKKLSKINVPSSIDMTPYTANERNTTYELMGYINHMGQSLEDGHYTASVKSPQNQWILYDDAKQPTIITDEESKSDAYILFYTLARPKRNIAQQSYRYTADDCATDEMFLDFSDSEDEYRPIDTSSSDDDDNTETQFVRTASIRVTPLNTKRRINSSLEPTDLMANLKLSDLRHKTPTPRNDDVYVCTRTFDDDEELYLNQLIADARGARRKLPNHSAQKIADAAAKKFQRPITRKIIENWLTRSIRRSRRVGTERALPISDQMRKDLIATHKKGGKWTETIKSLKLLHPHMKHKKKTLEYIVHMAKKTPQKIRGKWSEAEENMLTIEFSKYGLNYQQYTIPNRDLQQIKSKVRFLLKAILKAQSGKSFNTLLLETFELVADNDETVSEDVWKKELFSKNPQIPSSILNYAFKNALFELITDQKFIKISDKLYQKAPPNNRLILKPKFRKLNEDEERHIHSEIAICTNQSRNKTKLVWPGNKTLNIIAESAEDKREIYIEKRFNVFKEFELQTKFEGWLYGESDQNSDDDDDNELQQEEQSKKTESQRMYVIFTWYKACRVLNVSSLGLESLRSKDFDQATNLLTLIASHNQLINVPSSLFYGAKKLSVVDMSYNSISQIDPMAFYTNSKMTLLDLSHNLIVEIDNRTLAPLTGLEVLDLQWNRVANISTGLFDELGQLRELKLGNNRLKQVECSVFTYLSNLKMLDLNQNQLAVFDANCVQSTTSFVLLIEENELSSLSLTRNVSEINVSANNISKISIDGDLENMTVFNTSKNVIENIVDVIQLLNSSLRILDISDSTIGKLNVSTFEKFDNLERLSLRNTKLSNIQYGTFHHQQKLRLLDLSDNDLKKINFEMLHWNSANLEELHLDGNNLDDLSNLTAAMYPSLQYVSIDGNKFDCDDLSGIQRQWKRDGISVVFNPHIISEVQAIDTHVNGITCYHNLEASKLLIVDNDNVESAEISLPSTSTSNFEAVSMGKVESLLICIFLVLVCLLAISVSAMHSIYCRINWSLVRLFCKLGMYEDPSALFKGWQENPVDFDSVFNRSDTTYAWGSPDILTIFEKKSNNRNIRAFAYDKVMQDFSGSHSTTALDTWVFDNVERFVNTRREQLKSDNETVYFLHLLGLDTAGHTHKPNTKLFIDNLIAVDQGVERINKLFNQVFPDDRTAFIFTADHGMTDRGSHGDGDDYETQTPIVAWGAGIPKHTDKPTTTTDQLHSIIGSTSVPRFDINQIDIAPLMATLLGIPVPVNSYGQLPLEYLNASASYTATAMFHNALQIAEQYKHLRNEFLTGSLSKYLNDYHTFDGSHMTSAEIQINWLLDAGKYDEAIQRSKQFLEQSLNGVEFFQSYYQYWLLTAVALSMIAWICYLVQAPLRTSSKNVLDVNLQINKSYSYVALFGVFLVLVFGYCQSLSIPTAIIFCAPFVCWLPISFTSILKVIKDFRVFVLIAAVESLVWTFFYRQVVSVLLVLVPIYILISNDDRRRFCLVNKKWLLTNILLSVFPLLPIVGNNDNHSTELFTGLNIVCQIVSWICLISAFTLPLLQTTERRLEAVIDGLSIPYLLMALSYEPIFLLILSLNLEYFVEMHQTTVNQNQSFTNMTKRSEPNTYTNAFTFMLYVLLAFFGTGNLASISSFDPNSVRCFVAVFARALMSVLVVIKLVIPLLLVVCAFTGVYAAYKLPMDRIFLAILSICNIMGIHFLFLVTNKGSWLQIGTSISHFVIIETTTVALCALQLLAKLLMETELNFVRAKQRSSIYKFE